MGKSSLDKVGVGRGVFFFLSFRSLTFNSEAALTFFLRDKIRRRRVKTGFKEMIRDGGKEEKKWQDVEKEKKE